MKKLTATIATLLLGATISLAGCKKDDKGAKADDKTAKPTGDQKPAENAKPADDKPAAAASTGLPECDAYAAAVESFVKCDKIPQAARDNAKQGLDAMKSAWTNMDGVPDDVKQQTNDMCKQAVEGLKQGAAAQGCTI